MNIFSSEYRLKCDMQRILFGAALILLSMNLACSTLSSSRKNTLNIKDSIQVALDKIATENPEMSLGISLVRVFDKAPLFSYNEHKLFTPASTAKILTMAAALHYLGPQYRYDTELLTLRTNGKSIDNLYLRASGDPSFSSLDISQLVSEISQLGVRTVKGDIVIDSTVFDDVLYGQGWMADDMNEGFSAPISGISIDDNRITFGILPSDTPGSPVQITNFPDTRYFTIQNQTNTIAQGQQEGIKISMLQDRGVIQGGVINFNGTLASGESAKYESLAVADPNEFAAVLIAEALKKNGITFHGKLTRGTVPIAAKGLAHHLSAPLAQIIIDILKYSNNHATESLLKTIAVKQNGVPGTFSNGISALRTFLSEKVGVTLGGLVCVDGSGLSRYNLLSAQNLSNFLVYMKNDNNIGPEFVASLVRFDKDNSLVRAKSGSMRNIRSLAGYAQLETGDIVAFAILTHGTGTNPSFQKKAIENILLAIKNGK